MLDQYRFQQCLNNLLSNAIKFTPKGEVAVGVTSRETRSGKTLLLLSVKDTGIGMNDHALRTIFDPFKQADDSITRRFGGTGLGMAITKQLVGVLGGKISARSVEGDGTTFLIALPLKAVETATAIGSGLRQRPASVAPSPQPILAKSEPIDSAIAAPSRPSIPPQRALSTEIDISMRKSSLDQESLNSLSGLNILVAEDNPINQSVVKKLIGKVVKSLTFANNGEEAIEFLQTQNFDLVLMDIHMPIKDGIETTIAIRSSAASWANVPIIALTADPDYQQRRICRNIGMNDAIAKPVKQRDIIKAIQRMLSHERDAASLLPENQLTG